MTTLPWSCETSLHDSLLANLQSNMAVLRLPQCCFWYGPVLQHVQNPVKLRFKSAMSVGFLELNALYALLFSFVYIPDFTNLQILPEIVAQVAMVLVTTIYVHKHCSNTIPSKTTIPFSDILACFYRDKVAIFYVFFWCSLESCRIILELDASTKLQEGTRLVLEDQSSDAKRNFMKLVFNSACVIVLYRGFRILTHLEKSAFWNEDEILTLCLRFQHTLCLPAADDGSYRALATNFEV